MNAVLNVLTKWVAKKRENYQTDAPRLYHNVARYYGIDRSRAVNEMLGDPDGEPFVVQVSNAGWIPANILVYAASEEDARARVLGFMERALAAYKEAERHFTKSNQHQERHYVRMDVERAEKVLELAQQHMKVEPFDKRYVTKATWAGNDTII